MPLHGIRLGDNIFDTLLFVDDEVAVAGDRVNAAHLFS